MKENPDTAPRDMASRMAKVGRSPSELRLEKGFGVTPPRATLTSFTAEYDHEYEDYSTYEAYATQSFAASEHDQVNDCDSFLGSQVALLMDSGLDLENDESCALAAGTMQLEAEAFNVRAKAQGKGHGGFGAHKQFEVSGQYSLQERKARLQQLKGKTTCRRCGHKGHWSGDTTVPEANDDQMDKQKVQARLEARAQVVRGKVVASLQVLSHVWSTLHWEILRRTPRTRATWQFIRTGRIQNRMMSPTAVQVFAFHLQVV